MNKEYNAKYDDYSIAECMYPLPGENIANFRRRMKELGKKIDSRMTDEDRQIAEALRTGKHIEILKKPMKETQ